MGCTKQDECNILNGMRKENVCRYCRESEVPVQQGTTRNVETFPHQVDLEAKVNDIVEAYGKEASHWGHRRGEGWEKADSATPELQ